MRKKIAMKIPTEPTLAELIAESVKADVAEEEDEELGKITCLSKHSSKHLVRDV
jgi:hypothetical protein